MRKPAILAGFVGFPGAFGTVRAEPTNYCTLLTQAEAAVALGAPVKPGEMSISGCQWGAQGGSGFVQIQVAGARYYQRPPKQAKMISGVGLEAYSYTEMDSPHAITRTNRSVIVVWTDGEKASFEKVVDLLKIVVDRVERE